MAEWAPDIFEYVDYRDYLRDYYHAAKEHTRGFSYRAFSRRAGFSSPNFLKLIIDGKRSLGSDSVERFATALRLSADEGRFFAALVAFNQARTTTDKNEAFERVAASRRFRRARRIDMGLFAYLSRWYYPAIREMAALPGFEADAAWLAPRLVPPIKPREAQQALDVLFDLGLLVRDPEGGVTRGEPSVSTGHEVQSLAIGNYHRAMLTLAAESIERVPSHQRDLGALTVSISAATMAELKRRIHDFRERVLELCDRDSEPSAVYQMNIQLFPLTTPVEQPEEVESTSDTEASE